MTAPLPDAVMRALGRSDASPGEGQAGIAGSAFGSGSFNTTATGAAGAEHASAKLPFDAWYHVELLPGLVLQLSATASPAIKSAAKRICDEYRGE